MASKDRLDYVALEEDLRKKLAKHNLPADKPLTKTQLWYWSAERAGYHEDIGFRMCDEPRPSFSNTPPIYNSPTSNRILVVTTKYEGQFLDRIINEISTTKDIDAVLDAASKKLVKHHDEDAFAKVLSAKLLWEKIAQTPEHVVRCSRMIQFWPSFFGVEDFMDDVGKTSVPQAMITTGYIRTYGCLGGCTDNVLPRLQEIAKEFKIPLTEMLSFAP